MFISEKISVYNVYIFMVSYIMQILCQKWLYYYNVYRESNRIIYSFSRSKYNEKKEQ